MDETAVLQEVADWRKAGWRPAGPFARAVLEAWVTRRSGFARLADMELRPWIRAYGADVVAEAVRRVADAVDGMKREARAGKGWHAR